jgi:hypothetical protein
MLRRKIKTQFENKSAKRVCALKLFKAHGAAPIEAKNASFHNQIFKAQITQAQLF